MAEASNSTPKRRRVKVRFLPAPNAPRPDPEDPVEEFQEPSWLLEVSEQGAQVPLGRWELWNPSYLQSADTLKVAAILERETVGAHAFVTQVRERVHLLAPDIPDETFELLSHRQLLAIAEKSYRFPSETAKEAIERKADAANPPAGERDSASSSRSPRDSMAGAMPS